ncbi:MAG: isoprenylcysteine carboxylmethyltransferase family protein [Prolixibacteraceae bacterium]|jgi:protein-S-isoprenylcysteine O-methyltransferase Ste14|nr:isoprenylcysteine carboxylmethyltransferase family protein [Prolixibacteraceae bacterium]
MTEVHGRVTINPVLFYTGKAAGFGVWFAGLYVMLWAGHLRQTVGWGFDLAAMAALIPGILLVLASSFSLGSALRIGLPREETRLRTGGIYRWSRNPMYVGVHLVTLAVILFTLRWWTLLPGLYSFYVYHLIVRGEEAFLEERFGEAYRSYRGRTPRYL